MTVPITMQRRFCFSLLFAALAAVALPASAQSDVHKQLAAERFTIVSPFPPGGPVDTLARMLSDGLAKRYGQAAVVDNQVGAAGNIGMEKVKRAKGDGHTLLVIPAGNVTINPTLMPNFPFDMQKDFVPITMLAKAPNVLVASPASGIKSVKELVAQAKAKPGTLSYASPGVGSGLHLAGELFKQQAGIDLLHVPL
jgi:tripartite-type tricarboxylate transporter receptor subunit TctC